MHCNRPSTLLVLLIKVELNGAALIQPIHSSLKQEMHSCPCTEREERLNFCLVHELCCYVECTKTHKLQLPVCHVHRKTVNKEALSLAFDKLMCQQAETQQWPPEHILH